MSITSDQPDERSELGSVHALPDDLLDLLPVGVYVCDRDGLIVRYNRRAAELWGRSPKPGDPKGRYCGSYRLHGTDGSAIPHADCPMAHVLATGTGVRDEEVVIERPDGSRIVALVTIEPLRDERGRLTGAVNVFRDHSEQHERERRQREQERRLREIFEAVPVALYTTDPDGRITFYNQAASELWDVQPEITKTKFCGSWRLAWPDGSPMRHDECPMAVALREQRPIRGGEAEAVRPDGRRVPFLAYPTPLFDETGALTGAVNVLVDISERREAERRITESETRYREIFDTAGVALWEEDFSGVVALFDVLRAEGVADLRRHLQDHPELVADAISRVRATNVNRFAVEMFEADGREALLGSLEETFLPETSAIFVEELVALFEGRARFESETVVRTLKGRQLHVMFTVAFEGSRAERTLVSLLDISAQKEAELTLRRQGHRLATLNRVVGAISGDLDLDRIVQVVTDAATELSGARFGAFFYNVADDQGERYTLYALSGAPREAFERFGLPRNTAVFEQTFRGLGVVRADDIRKDPRYGRSAPHYGMPKGHLPVVSYLAVPVISRSGEVHGGLFFGHDQPGVFTEEVEEDVVALAAHTAIALDSARLLQTVQRELEQRRAAELAALRLAAIVESSEDAILSKDLDGIVTSWNAAAERLFGYSQAEMIGRPMTLIIPEDRQHEEPRILARIRAGKRVEPYETVRCRKDGSRIDMSVVVSPLRNAEGEIVGASTIARDITERKRAEEQQRLLLREMEHRVKNLFTVASSVVALSARSAESPQELAATVRERLGALGRGHALTLRSGDDATANAQAPASLQALIDTILSPYDGQTGGGTRRIRISGSDLNVHKGAITSLALVLQELATNATKHGALSSPDGRIEIACQHDAERIVIAWTERGGPLVEAEVQGEGFGSVLCRAGIAQLDGSLEHEWRREGLATRLVVPRSRIAEPDDGLA